MKAQKTSLIKDFKKFINKGNAIDLAIGVIIGSTFTAIVNSIVNDIIMPLISSVIKFDISSAKITLVEEVIKDDKVVKQAVYLKYGNFIQTFLNFLIVAFSIYFAYKLVIRIKNAYIIHQVKYIKKLKEKHPEFFDEEDEFGTVLYEKLKAKYPEHFKDELAQTIEEEKPKKTVEEMQLELLNEINKNILNLKNSGKENE